MKRIWLLLLVPACGQSEPPPEKKAVALGEYKVRNNEVQREYEADYDLAWGSARTAMRDLGYRDIVEKKEGRGVIECKRGDGAAVVVVVEPRGAKNVFLSVRVGAFESESTRSEAQKIHEKIYYGMGGR